VRACKVGVSAATGPAWRVAIVLAMAALFPPPSFAAAASPAGADRLDVIRQRGSLRVAVLHEYPWLKQTATGGPDPFEGAAWLLAREYARRLGVRLQTVPVTFADKVTVLAEDRADITIAPLLRTAAREAMVDMVSYSTAAHCVFGRADNPKLADVSTLDNLNRPDITIGVIAASPQGAWLRQRLPAATLDEVPGSIAELATAEIIAGRADVAPIDKFFFAGLSRSVPGLVSIPRGGACLDSEELSIPIAMAVAKGQPAFLTWLRNVTEDARPAVAAEHARVVRAGP
jgi:polar amino acid transport system substrate-binding protein